MNFSVIVGEFTPRSKAIKYGKYLNSVDQGEQRIRQEECVNSATYKRPLIRLRKLFGKRIQHPKCKVVFNSVW